MRFPAPSCHRPIATHFHFLPHQTLQVLHSRVVPLHCSALQVPEWSRKTSEAAGQRHFGSQMKPKWTQKKYEKMMQHSYPSIYLSFARSLPLSLSLSHLSIMHKYSISISIILTYIIYFRHIIHLYLCQVIFSMKRPFLGANQFAASLVLGHLHFAHLWKDTKQLL